MTEKENDVNYKAYQKDLLDGELVIGQWVAYVNGVLVGSNDNRDQVLKMIGSYQGKPRLLTQAGINHNVEISSVLSVEYEK